MGDLNFRLVEEYEKSPEEIWDMVKRKDIKSLLMFDQLQYVRNRGEAFSEFEEGEIKFPPTYKFEKDDDEYDMKYVIDFIITFSYFNCWCNYVNEMCVTTC